MIIETLTSPVILFFVLGFVAALLKSDLSVPEAFAKAMSIYLMAAIGLKGGVEVSSSGITPDLIAAALAGLALSFLLPVIAFALLRNFGKLSNIDAGAVAAHYGSVSVVTFVTAKEILTGQGLTPVEWGGETEMVLVSAKKHQNLTNLLETVLLTTDILDLKASPTRLASGVVLEAKLDRGRGSVATVLVQQGTLRVQDPFIVGQIFGKVRAMYNDRGETVTEAGPATPVEVLGLQGVPQAGDTFQVVSDTARAQQTAHHRQMMARQTALAQTTKRGIEALGQAETKELLVVIKADVQGSVEVLKSTLEKLSTGKVSVKVVRSGVGAITESDVLLASATQANSTDSAVVIIGFNVRPEVRAGDVAKEWNVEIRLHSVIYKVEEEIRAAMVGLLDAIEQEKILGRAEVRDIFRVPRAGVIAGCMVRNGLIRRTARARLVRDSIVVWEGNIGSLRRFKEDVAEVREGFECGIGLENFNDLKTGDQIEAYIIEKVAATEL